VAIFVRNSDEDSHSVAETSTSQLAVIQKPEDYNGTLDLQVIFDVQGDQGMG